jgi:hypothetical protein
VHFPILFTLVCALFLRLSAILPYAIVVLLCTLIGGAVSLTLAVLFERWIDRPAIRFSRAVRAPWLIAPLLKRSILSSMRRIRERGR